MAIISTQTPLGHLPLVVTDDEYNEVSKNTPFCIPTDPGPSAPNLITTAINTDRRSARTVGNDNEPTTNTTTTETEIQYSMLPYIATESIRSYNAQKKRTHSVHRCSIGTQESHH